MALACLALLAASPSWARVTTDAGVAGEGTVRDLAQVRSSGVLRVLINESRTSSGEVKDQTLGMEYQRVRAFVQALNQDAQAGRTIRLQLIPKPKTELLAALRRGEGDLVAPGELLPVESLAGITASTPVKHAVPMVVVARRGNRQYQKLTDLSGRELMLARGSVALGALERLNTELKHQNKAQVTHQVVDPSLAVEDVLEMVNAGMFLLTAVELPIAERWAKVLPNIRIDRHMTLTTDHQRWYVRRGASNLLARVDRFARNYRIPADRDAQFQRLYRRVARLHNVRGDLEVRRLRAVRPVLERVAREQNLDWPLLAAIAYKESTLNPQARGGGGATGLMQVTPVAARAVGVKQYSSLEGNVLAGAKYLNLLHRQYFSSKQISEVDRYGFMLAAYNLGPNRVEALRAEARRRGLDANRWYFQVERVAMQQMGMTVPRYVTAVNQYRTIYQREFAR